ncbi:hypothetical protein BGZ95_002346 [Linnemannia exigua]|uniref:Uncharacterized protein n=1 Tax=Linnemannia exigua TaxID=604196 RepID=A0AAD4D666_9FUNG|nr:hypothetical protein BGZ95_002346 [Linnemannia exigua]
MPLVFVETFKSLPLSSWPLLTNTSLPSQLTGDVTIVGYNDRQPKLAISHQNITTQPFMKAHVENNSKLGDQILKKSDVEKALGTISSHAVQKKMDKEQEKIEEKQKKIEKEQMKRQEQGQQKSTTSVPSDQHQPPQLQDYCPSGKYISMVITHPAEVVNFQVVRPDPEPELEGLQRVSIGIDDNNFPKIFPRRHVDFLDKPKGHKRRSEDQQSQKSKKKKANDPLQCDEQ